MADTRVFGSRSRSRSDGKSAAAIMTTFSEDVDEAEGDRE